MGRQGKIMLDVPSGTLAAMAVLGMAFLLGGGAGCLLGGMVNGAGGRTGRREPRAFGRCCGSRCVFPWRPC